MQDRLPPNAYVLDVQTRALKNATIQTPRHHNPEVQFADPGIFLLSRTLSIAQPEAYARGLYLVPNKLQVRLIVRSS